jgi:hypothetical protein
MPQNLALLLRSNVSEEPHRTFGLEVIGGNRLLDGFVSSVTSGLAISDDGPRKNSGKTRGNTVRRGIRR